MQIIQPSSKQIMTILSKPKASEDGYRLSRYVLQAECEEGHLLFNTMSREMILLDKEEYAHVSEMEELRTKWFLIPSAMEEQKAADQVRFLMKTMAPRSNELTSYTVFSTTDCNARCFYCYEMGRSRIFMNEDTARKTAEFIAEHCGGKRVKLRWFGGEPLYNASAIDTICQTLEEKGVTYVSSMISNGYLFTEETVQKAAELWHLRNVQITLDGTEEVYNHTKAFIYGGNTSPYKTVLENIERLLKNGIGVSVRLNMDYHNDGNLMELADVLKERFAGEKKLSVYSHVLFEHAGNTEMVRAAEERRELYRRQDVLQAKLREYGFIRRTALKKQLPLNMCMVDSGKAVTVLPDGHIGLCEHFSEDHFIGHVEQKELDMEAAAELRKARPHKEACRTCFMYPECENLAVCEEMEECYPEMLAYAETKLKDSMLYTYEAWKKQEETEEEEEPERF